MGMWFTRLTPISVVDIIINTFHTFLFLEEIFICLLYLCHISVGCLYRAASAFMLNFELSENGSFQTAVSDRSQPLIDSLLILRATHFTVFSRLYERSFVRYRLNEVRFLFFLSSSQVCRCVFYFWSSSTSFRLSSFLLLFRERPDGLKPRNFGKSLAEYPDSWICGRLPEKFSRNSELASGTWHGRRTVYLCKGKDSLEPEWTWNGKNDTRTGRREGFSISGILNLLNQDFCSERLWYH